MFIAQLSLGPRSPSLLRHGSSCRTPRRSSFTTRTRERRPDRIRPPLLLPHTRMQSALARLDRRHIRWITICKTTIWTRGFSCVPRSGTNNPIKPSYSLGIRVVKRVCSPTVGGGGASFICVSAFLLYFLLLLLVSRRFSLFLVRSLWAPA